MLQERCNVYKRHNVCEVWTLVFTRILQQCCEWAHLCCRPSFINKNLSTKQHDSLYMYSLITSNLLITQCTVKTNATNKGRFILNLMQTIHP